MAAEKRMEKLAGNQNVRNTETGRFTDETERNDPERVVETDGKGYSDYVKGLIANGIKYEESGGGAIEFQSLMQWAVNGMYSLMQEKG